MLFRRSETSYIKAISKHYEQLFLIKGNVRRLDKGPIERLNPEFFILEFSPNPIHNFWTYCTVGMSIERADTNLIELFVYSPKKDDSLVELLTICASYHRNSLPINLNHTLNIGRPWLDQSICDHAFISLPYLDGDKIEIFNFEGLTYHCYWLIPITRQERDYKIEFGSEALEQLFEEKHLDYINANRQNLAF